MGKKKPKTEKKKTRVSDPQPVGKKRTHPTGINVPVLMEILTELKRKWNLSKFQEEIVVTQILVESEGLYMDEAINSKNVGGLKYAKNVTNALPSASYKANANESPKKVRAPYAVFPTWADYLYAHIKETALGKPNKIKDIPLNAANMDDFAHLITLNGYHQSTEGGYKKALKSWTPTVKRLLGEIESLEDRAIFIEESVMVPKYDNLFTDFLRFSNEGKTASKNQLNVPAVKIHDRYLRSAENSIPSLSELPPGEARISGFSAEKSPSGVGFMYKVLLKSRGQDGRIVSRAYNMPDKDALKKEAEINRYKAQYELPRFLKPLKPTSPADFSIPYILKSYNTHKGVKTASTTEGIQHISKDMLRLPTNVNEEAKMNTAEKLSTNIDDVFRAGGNYVTGDKNHDAGRDTGKSNVAVHLNTPLIGNLSLTTQNTSHSIDSIKMQVEQALLDVLNNVNIA